VNAYKLDRNKTVSLLRKIIKDEASAIADKMMVRFDDEIVPFEDTEDPARPSRFRSEFKQFLTDTINDNISIISTEAGSRGISIEINVGVGDADKMGFGEKLDEETTDGLRIIGTIIQGISGQYVLVTDEMTGGPEGRFGRAFIMPERQYRKEALSKEWDPNKPIWSFSDFPGIPDFFREINFNETVSIVTKKLAEALRR